jgi:DNA-directed RNA polymerase specialized sigma24 family protein
MKNTSSDASDSHLSDKDWEQLQFQIHTYVTGLVRSARHPVWRGQQNDVAWDITGESLYKLVMRIQRADAGKAPRIDCVDSFSKTIAYRCFIDEIRKSKYILWPRENSEDNPYEIGLWITPSDLTIDPAELAIENLSNEETISTIAVGITRIPTKQQNALLISLAWMCAFDEEDVTPLPRVLFKLGIQLQDYRTPIPKDRVTRSQHASLLTLAYKRLATFYNTPQPPTAA